MIFTLEDPFSAKHELNLSYIETVKKKLAHTRSFLKDIDTYAEFANDLKVYDFIVNDADPVARALEYRKMLERLKKTSGPNTPRSEAAKQLRWAITFLTV